MASSKDYLEYILDQLSGRYDVSGIACSKEEKEVRQTKAPHYQSRRWGALIMPQYRL